MTEPVRESTIDPLVSILIPVYNVERFIDKCLDSIVGQTYRNLQIVIVNDGSSDRSGEICDDYARWDKRIFVMHKENEGVASARNELLKHIIGDYFLFIDSDDWIEADMIEGLVRETLRHDSDITVCRHVVDDDKTVQSRQVVGQYDREESVKKFLQHKDLNGSLWNKLIKTSLFKAAYGNNMFPFDPQISYGEDALFCWGLLQRMDRMIVLDWAPYHYRRNRESISHQQYGKKKQSGDIVWRQITEMTAAAWPKYEPLARSRWKIENMWQIYFAAKSNYRRDDVIRYFQSEVKGNLKLIKRSGLLDWKKLCFACLASRWYALAKILTRFV